MKSTAIIVGIISAVIIMTGCSFWEDLPIKEEEETDTTTATREHSGGMVLVKAKDSSFKMGSDLIDNAKPVHTVRFTYDFWMDTTEVTQGSYDSIMTAFYLGYSKSSWDTLSGAGSTYPVFNRNWYDAVLYCNARSKRDTLDSVYRFDSIIGTPGNGSEIAINEINLAAPGYRLPTEAEWEFACRAGTKGEFYWGTTDVSAYEWHSGNSNGHANPVAKKKPNGYGLYDMCANVSEWCSDWYKEYSSQNLVDPFVQEPTGYRTWRGGNWILSKSDFYASTRSGSRSIDRNSRLGFRTVKRKS